MDKMGLRRVESMLPPGFRFHPSDEELVCHYLYNKVANIQSTYQGTMVEVDLHTREPWELPDVAKLSAKEWYFFSFRDRKYATGSRTNRATKSGYWKATGKDKSICEARTSAVVGMRKTLVFYRGRAPNGIKTAWVMHEFRLHTPNSSPKEDWVLCRVFNKMRKGDDDTTASSSLALDLPNKQDTECCSTALMQMQQQQQHQEEDHSSLLNMEALLLINPALVEDNISSDDQLGFLHATIDDVMGFHDHHQQQQQQQIMGEQMMMKFQFPRWQG